jgi:hypothetical protein
MTSEKEGKRNSDNGFIFSKAFSKKKEINFVLRPDTHTLLAFFFRDTNSSDASVIFPITKIPFIPLKDLLQETSKLVKIIH